MKSAIRRIAALAAATTTAAVGVISGLSPAIASQFGQQEVDQTKFVAVAAPLRGGSAHQLLVLEQVSSARPCWSEAGSTPVQVDPLLTTFDFTGICGRSTDSNGYSIRVNGEDLGMRYSLRVVHQDGNMMLVGAPNRRGEKALLIGQTNGMTNQFAKINLVNGWRFTKRTYDSRTLGHVYLTYEGDVAAIPSVDNIGGGTQPLPTPTPVPPVRFTFPDTATDIYRTEIEQAVQVGFVAGFSEDNTFRPQTSLTREQLVSMVLESLDRLPDVDLAIPARASSTPYRDVETSRWSAAKIQFARESGIVSGYEDGSFRPAQPVTRAELVAVLRQAALYGQRLQGETPNIEQTQTPVSFSDTTNHWAQQTISDMSGFCRIASPMNEQGNAFQPNTAAQRNYAAAATLRMLNCVSDAPVAPAAADTTSQG